MYAHIEDVVITHMGALPKKWRNISGLDKSKGNDAYLKTLGWVPLTTINVSVTRDQVYEPNQITVNKDSEGVPESIVSKQIIREMTIAEKRNRDNTIIEAIRYTRTERLGRCDWTMLTDSKLSEEKKTAWANYRQELRDLPATADITKWGTDDWVWPTEPE